MGNKKKENIQVEFKTHDWFDEDKIGEDEFVYKINNSKSFFFEVHNESTEMSDMKSKNDLLKGKGDILFVTRFPIQDISIEGSFGFEHIRAGWRGRWPSSRSSAHPPRCPPV